LRNIVVVALVVFKLDLRFEGECLLIQNLKEATLASPSGLRRQP
jgi:hypothetical protein